MQVDSSDASKDLQSRKSHWVRSSEFSSNKINRIHPDNECYTQEMKQKNEEKSNLSRWNDQVAMQVLSCIYI